MQPIKIIEIKSELGCAQLGASMGADAIKMAAHKAGSDFFAQREIISLPHRNHLLAKKNHPVGYEKAKWLRYILENAQIACNTVADVLEESHFPIVLSADHSSATGVIAGVKQAYPEQRIGIIWIDAHSDAHSPYTTHSGNMHGMPIGAALGLDAQARELIQQAPNPLPEPAQKQWQHFKELGGLCPKVLPEDLVFIGVRYFKPEHSALIEHLKIKLYSVDEVRQNKIQNIINAIHQQLQHCDKVYVSFDVDALDCDVVSNGTGTPEPNGLFIEEVVELMQGFAHNPKLCCLEISEVSPVLDHKGNAMAEAAWQVLNTLLKHR